MKNITIAIAGSAGTGKSTIAFLIKRTLEQYGITVNPINDTDYKSEEDFEYKIGSNFENAIEAIAKKTKVTVVQSQLMKELPENE